MYVDSSQKISKWLPKHNRESETTENKQRKNERKTQKATYLMSSCRKLDTHT